MSENKKRRVAVEILSVSLAKGQGRLIGSPCGDHLGAKPTSHSICRLWKMKDKHTGYEYNSLSREGTIGKEGQGRWVLFGCARLAFPWCSLLMLNCLGSSAFPVKVAPLHRVTFISTV